MPSNMHLNKVTAKSVETTELKINGTSVSSTSVLTGASDLVDLNGVADAFVLDADADTHISAPTDDQIDIAVSAADDFRITANTLTALSGSTIKTDTIAETTAGSGVTIDSLLVKDAGVVVGTGGALDLNGEAGGLVLDADGDTLIKGSTANTIDIEVAGAADFQITANTLTALSGSTIKANTIAETTSANGVAVDGLTVKDGGFALGTGGTADLNGEAGGLVLDTDGDTTVVASTDDTVAINVAGAEDFEITANTFTALSGSTIATNTIAETTATSGVTIDGTLVKDGGVTCSGTVSTDTIAEKTSAAGVTIDGALIKDAQTNAGLVSQELTSSGAITLNSGLVLLNHATVAVAATLDAPAVGDHLYIVDSSATGTAAHTVKAGAGVTFDGTNNTATLNALGEALEIVAITTTRWLIMVNLGSVGLSST